MQKINKQIPILESCKILQKQNISIFWVGLCNFLQSHKHYGNLSNNRSHFMELNLL